MLLFRFHKRLCYFFYNTDAGFVLLFRCHNLVYASFCYCEHVTDAGVELLGTLPSLISLDLSGCNIQDQGVAALGNNPKFRDITLAECPNITDLGLQVCTGCHFLLLLLVSRYFKMSRLCFVIIFRDITLAECPNTTDLGWQVCKYERKCREHGVILATVIGIALLLDVTPVFRYDFA